MDWGFVSPSLRRAAGYRPPSWHSLLSTLAPHLQAITLPRGSRPVSPSVVGLSPSGVPSALPTLMLSETEHPLPVGSTVIVC